MGHSMRCSLRAPAVSHLVLFAVLTRHVGAKSPLPPAEEGSSSAELLAEWFPTSQRYASLHSAAACSSIMRLLPHCTSCIPGVVAAEGACTSPPALSKYLAWNAAEATRRYGNLSGSTAAPDLYSYLMSASGTRRHVLTARYLKRVDARNVLDLGPYRSPIAGYLRDAGHCAELTVSVQPIMPAASERVPCLPPNWRDATHRISSPLFAADAPSLLPALGLARFDAIVCLGCFPEQIKQPAAVCSYLARFPRPFTFVVEAGQKAEFAKWLDNVSSHGGCLLAPAWRATAATARVALRLSVVERLELEIPEEPTGNYRHRLLAFLNVSDGWAVGARSAPSRAALGGNVDAHASKESKLKLYQQLALTAESIAAQHGPLFGATPSAGAPPSSWARSDGAFSQAATFSTTPRGAIPAALIDTGRWLVGCNVERQQHQLLSAITPGGAGSDGGSGGDDLPSCAAGPVWRDCDFFGQHSTVKECSADLACRHRACSAVRTCHAAPRDHFSRSDCKRWQTAPCASRLLSLHAAAAVVCGEHEARQTSEENVTAAVAMLGLGWMAASGSVAPLRHGLVLQSIIRRFVEQMSHYSDRAADDPTSSWRAVERRLPLPPATLTCPAAASVSDPALVRRLEPIYPHLRNLMTTEMGLLTSFVPYRVLPSVVGFDTSRGAPRPHQAANKRGRRVLVDVGTNGFYASAKYLLDLYQPTQPFTEAVLFEPDTKAMGVPEEYMLQYNITRLHSFVDVGSRRPSSDLLVWLQRHVRREDYVVLKFDVDEAVSGPTIEWGFLADLHGHPALALVDELFIEMHFSWLPGTCSNPRAVFADLRSPSWTGKPHSMEQAYFLLADLRRCGVAVHAWP